MNNATTLNLLLNAHPPEDMESQVNIKTIVR
jgi:hypothetical protein